MVAIVVPEGAVWGGMVPTTPFTATVAGIHAHAINLSLSDAYGEYYVSIVHRRAEWTELAIRLDEEDWKSLHHRLQQSQGARVGVYYNARDRNHETTVTLSGSLQRLSNPSALLHRVFAAASEASESTRDSSSLGLLDLLNTGTIPTDIVAAKVVEILADATQRQSDSLELSRLVGLGRGATPAGDDFLSGILLFETVLPRRVLPALDREAISLRLRQTTPGGASLLRVSLAAYPPAYQIDMVEALAAGSDDEAISIVTSHGATSGFDTLAGFLWRSTIGGTGPD